MVYESFFESKLLQAKTGMGKGNQIPSLLMRIGAKAMDQAMGVSYFTHGFKAFLDTDLDEHTGWDENTAQNWLIWHLHGCLIKQIGTEQLRRYLYCLAKTAWEESDKLVHICYILPFLAYYESQWNERKGYGELVSLARRTKECCVPEHENPKDSKASYGNLMAAMAQCYEEMTEEAYDQREVFADLSQSYAIAFQKHLKPQTGCCSQDSVLAAYALLKGMRLGILHHELYGGTAKEILTTMEAEGFTLKNGTVCLKDETEDKSYEKAMYCMMAYGEYIKLRKERPYYGI